MVENSTPNYGVWHMYIVRHGGRTGPNLYDGQYDNGLLGRFYDHEFWDNGGPHRGCAYAITGRPHAKGINSD